MNIFEQYKAEINKSDENIVIAKNSINKSYNQTKSDNMILEIVDDLCKILFYSTAINISKIDINLGSISIDVNETTNTNIYHILSKLFDIYNIKFDANYYDANLYFCLNDKTSSFNMELYRHYSKGTKVKYVCVDYHHADNKFIIKLELTEDCIRKIINK